MALGEWLSSGILVGVFGFLSSIIFTPLGRTSIVFQLRPASVSVVPNDLLPFAPISQHV